MLYAATPHRLNRDKGFTPGGISRTSSALSRRSCRCHLRCHVLPCAFHPGSASPPGRVRESEGHAVASFRLWRLCSLVASEHRRTSGVCRARHPFEPCGASRQLCHSARQYCLCSAVHRGVADGSPRRLCHARRAQSRGPCDTPVALRRIAS